MTKLTLAFALLLTATAAARAQAPNGNPPNDPLRNAMRLGDAAKAGEAMIEASRASNVRLENEANAARRSEPRTFDAKIKVTNSAAQAIKAVYWTATLTDPETGAVIRSYDLTTEARIAPGSTKKLSKRLRTPRDSVARAGSRPRNKPAVADLKVKVTGVTYVDGSTSTTP